MTRTRTLDQEGPGAPPRQNGELVFEEPWESRAFGLAVSLHERGVFDWEEFRACLIGAIAEWERAHPDGEGYSYYACWLAALETLVSTKALCDSDELEDRTRAFAARPAGHDH